jgi:translation initiation factor 1|eukprot:SAG25_NODE_2667_length_1459_cov_1.089706_2_plen_58_part_00
MFDVFPPPQDLSCNGSVTTDEQFGEVIQVQGDQRMAIAEFFVSQKFAKKSNIKVHGF